METTKKKKKAIAQLVKDMLNESIVATAHSSRISTPIAYTASLQSTAATAH